MIPQNYTAPPEYWGYNVSTNPYLISRQCYHEIQMVLYYKFVFDLSSIDLRTRPQQFSSGLGFLPLFALQNIQSITLRLKEDWNTMSHDSTQQLQAEHELLVQSLPNLSAVAFKLDCVKPGSLEEPGTYRRLVSSSRRTEITNRMSMLVRPFKQVMEINFIFWCSSLYTVDDMYPVESPAVLWEDLFLDCARLLEEERALLDYPFKLRTNVYAEGYLVEGSIWHPEIFYNPTYYLCNCFRCPLG
jgi:hypothetical protein